MMEPFCAEQAERASLEIGGRAVRLLVEHGLGKEAETLALDYAVTLTAIKEMGLMPRLLEWRALYKEAGRKWSEE